MTEYIKKSAAIHAVLHNEGQAAVAAVQEIEAHVGTWDERYIEDANPLFRRRFYCTACGQWQTHGKTRFCPNCGAYMGKEQTDE